MTPVPSIGEAFVSQPLLETDCIGVQANHWID
jgi:hypothetical protein